MASRERSQVGANLSTNLTGNNWGNDLILNHLLQKRALLSPSFVEESYGSVSVRPIDMHISLNRNHKSLMA